MTEKQFRALKPGDVVYDAHRHKMGNTTMSTVGVWTVRIVSVDAEKQTVLASWNGNRARTYTFRMMKSYRVEEPILVKSGLLGQRFATREEKKAVLAARAERKKDKA